ncbi:MAG: AAA+-type ATPase, SpoVK/Ycf46/Vps4 family/Cyt c-type biogenesis protein CcmH/NrfG/MoxR-like ATPase [Verrucomicrobia bacterium]|jgi:SpoVK/Ycf46/Vps4 family AAA+-type ATPase|nr:MAG: AAA+-type ATPase, SpoVK/Ycf46/Vps4 family/Cyt c-type biogenesis protein CcmH/NrfG/MoxR-like ATPase [Verrucomicrobiota bacterium]
MQSLSTLRRAIEDSPTNVRLWLLFGQTLVSQGELSEARRAFNQAIVLAPADPEARLGIAQVLFREGTLSEAAVRTQCILKTDANFAPAHLLMARIYLAENEIAKANEHYAKARSINQELADGQLEKDLLRHGRNRLPQIDRTETDDRLRLAAGFNMEADDFEWPDQVDSELASREGPSIGQDEFDFVDDDDLGFNIDEFERPKGSFADVAGLEDVKQELLMRLVYPYEYTDLFRAYGKKAGGGVLLYGPPGCGKSLVCRALAGETKAAFYSLRLHQVLEMYIGCSEKNLNSLFQMARENAPSIIFIDELDALAGHRGEAKQHPARSVVNQLLIELDGHDGSNEGVLIIAATSAIANVDSAFLRPGRFDRRILVPLPCPDSRAEILRMQARNRPVAGLDYDRLAAMLQDYSGADIAQVFDVAAEDALRIAMRKKEIVPITMETIEVAIKKVEPSARYWRPNND